MKRLLRHALLLAVALALSPALANAAVTIAVPAGTSLIANPLDNGSNTLAEIMPSVPGGTQLIKFDNATQTYRLATFDELDFVWKPANVTLSPGEGAFLESPGSFSLRLTGTARRPFLASLPEGACYLLSSPTPTVSTFENIVAGGARPGDSVHQWTNGGYRVFTFDMAWSPSEPQLAVGESAWFCRGGTLPSLSLLPVITSQPQHQTVLAGSEVNFTVGTTSAPPLTYRWMFCPQPNWNQPTNLLPVTSPTLTLSNVQPADAGDYLVVVSSASGSVTSQVAHLTVVPSYGINILPGDNLIANQVIRGSNRLDDIMRSVPEGTTLSKWDKAAQSYLPADTYFFGLGWLDADYNPSKTTLNPGEGALLNSASAFTLTFSGLGRAPVLPVSVDGLYALLSAQTPDAASYETIVGEAPTAGVHLRRFDPTNQLFVNYEYRQGPGWTPAVPSVRVGEAVFISTGASAQPLQPFCQNFDDRQLHGWGALSTNTGFALVQPGPSGNSNDYYLHCSALSGAATVKASAEFYGDWTEFANSGCAQFCYDLQIFDDGYPTNLDIVPSFQITGANGKRFRWVSTNPAFVTEPGGSNSGWFRICAPIGPLVDATLPGSTNGYWTTLPGTVNTDWPGVLASVTDITFPLDFTASTNEVIGLDNLCLTNGCGCLIVNNEVVECNETNKTCQYSFCVTNQFTGPIRYLLLLDPPLGVTFTPDIITLPQGLQPGQGTCLTVRISYTSDAPTNLCFRFGAHDSNLVQCCSSMHCVVRDTAGPRLVSAVPACNTNKITVAFDEPLDPATVLAKPNFIVDDLTQQISLVFQSTTFGADFKTVCLYTAEPLSVGTQYRLTVNNVTDTSGNLIASNSRVDFRCRDGAPRLNFTFIGGRLCVSWMSDAVLEYATSLTPPIDWTPAADQSNPQCSVPAGTQKFFRLRGN